MNPINTYAKALSAGQYVPHMYGFRQLHGYEHPAGGSRGQPKPGAYAVYDFSSDQPSSVPDDKLQTVEHVIERGYLAVPNSEPEFAVIHDKKHTAWLGLDDVIAQIRHREDIYVQNLYEIELAKCDAINALFMWEAQYGWPASAKEQYTVGKRLQAIYADQREERVTAWKDISRLKQSLPEVAQQYLAAFRKVSILEDTQGDDV